MKDGRPLTRKRKAKLPVELFFLQPPVEEAGAPAGSIDVFVCLILVIGPLGDLTAA